MNPPWSCANHDRMVPVRCLAQQTNGSARQIPSVSRRSVPRGVRHELQPHSANDFNVFGVGLPNVHEPHYGRTITRSRTQRGFLPQGPVVRWLTSPPRRWNGPTGCARRSHGTASGSRMGLDVRGPRWSARGWTVTAANCSTCWACSTRMAAPGTSSPMSVVTER